MEDQKPAAEMADEALDHAQTPDAGQEEDGQAEAGLTEGAPEGEGQEPEPEGDEADQADDKPRKETAKERRERQKARFRAIEQERDELRARIAQEEARKTQIMEAARQEQPPREQDFVDYTEFAVAKALYEQERRRAERTAQESDQAREAAARQDEALQKQRIAAQAEEFKAQVQEARAVYADFDQVVFDESTLMTRPLVEMILEADRSADLAYRVASDHQAAARLSELAQRNPVLAARELGRIEAQLAQSPARPPTRAPKPISPVRPAAAGTVQAESMSMDAYIQAREAGKLK